MNILFVQPRVLRGLNILGRATINISGTPYMSIQQLVAATPNKHSIELIDERFDKIDFEKKYDLVAIMKCYTMYAFRAYEIADKFRKKGIPVIIGGWHPTAFPDEAKQHADSVLIGEQEGIWLTILKDVEKKQPKSFYKAEKYLEAENIPPHQSNIKISPFPTGRLEVGRGCPQDCEFCMTPVMHGTDYRLRPIDTVIEEIKTIKQKTILITEPSITLDPEYAKKLFKEMKPLNKKFFCFGHTDVLNKDEELLKLSAEAGCLAWWIDFESFSQETLNSLGKKTNKIEEYASAINKIHSYGISVIGTLIFGLDTDTLEVFNETRKALKNLEIDALEVNIVCPLPGTPLFEKLDKQGRILTKDWPKYDDFNIVFQPKNMTPEELWIKSHEVAKEFYSYPDYLKRIIRGLKLNFSSFLYILSQNYFERRYYKTK
ncbi:MAG: B12-binding domain-containing radical SAM protein [Thermoplasmatales archaeon]|nr:B12-binding domain-containing radical SAM protein [Thermoplasmatales archaeon]